MAQAPRISILKETDFAIPDGPISGDQLRDTLRRLFSQLNPFFDGVTKLGSRGLTFTDNFRCELISGAFSSGVAQQVLLKTITKGRWILPLDSDATVGRAEVVMIQPTVTVASPAAQVTLWFVNESATNVNCTFLLLEDGGVKSTEASQGLIGKDITVGQLPIDASESSQVVPGSVVSTTIGSGAVQTTNIATGAVTTATIAGLAVDLSKLADGSVNAAKLVDGAVIASKLAITVGGANLLTNSSFEDITGALNGWTSGGSGTYTTAAGDATQKKYGTQSAKFVQTQSGLDTYYYQRYSLPKPSTSYTLSGWVYVTAITAGATGNRSMLIWDGTNSLDERTLDSSIPLNTWVRKQVSFSTSGAPSFIECRIYQPNGTVFWDGIQLEEGDVPTSYAPLVTEITPQSIGTIALADLAVTTAKLTDTSVTNAKIAAAAVDAGKLADLAVTASKLGAQIPGDNLVKNSSFEADSDSDGIADGWGSYNNSPGLEPSTLSLVTGRLIGNAQQVSWSVNNTTQKGVLLLGAAQGVQGGWQANKTYVVSWYAKASSTNVGQTMLLGWNTPPSTTTTLANPALTTSFQRYAFRITWGASVETGPVGGLYVTIASGSGTNGTLVIDDLMVAEGDVLTAYAPRVSELIAGAVGTTELAANAVTAAKIAAHTITASNIAADTITANEIAAAAIGASEIAAGAVVAKSLTITNFDNLWPNGNSEAAAPSGADTTATEWSGLFNPGGGNAYSGNFVRKILSNGLTEYFEITDTVPCSPGDQFYFETYAKLITGTNGSTSLYIYARFYDVTGSQTQDNTTLVGRPSSWTKYSVTTGVAPANTTQVRFCIGLDSTASNTSGEIGYYDALYARRMADGNLIVDGSITTNELAANAVTAAKIAAHTITAGEIAATTITATELATDSVTSAKIAAGAVIAAKIGAGEITAGKIAAGVVGTTELAANSVVAGKIAAGAISADKISANQIVAAKISQSLTNYQNYWPNPTSEIDPPASYTPPADGTDSEYDFRSNVGANPAAYSGIWVREVTRTTAGTTTLRHRVPASPGESYGFRNFHRYTATAGTPTAKSRIRFLDKDFNLVGTALETTHSTSDTSWTATTTLLKQSAPSDTAYVEFAVELATAASGTATIRWDAFVAFRILDPADLPDSAISPYQVGRCCNARAKRSTAQSITNAAFNTFIFLTEDWDGFNAYDSGTGVFTCPNDTSGHSAFNGKYRVAACVTFPNTGPIPNYILSVFVNGTEWARLARASADTDSFGGVGQGLNYVGLSGSCTVRLVTGDTVDVRVYQDSGGALNSEALAVANWVEFQQIVGGTYNG